jgi:hypothetical protein
VRQRPVQQRPNKPHPSKTAPNKANRLARLIGAFLLWLVGLSAVAMTSTGAAASGQGSGVSPSTACAAEPAQAGCTVTAISLSTSGLGSCASTCELDVGATVELTIEAIYIDGSEGALSAVAGDSGPQASFSTAPQPSSAFTLSGVVNGAGGVAEVQLTADEATAVPAVVDVAYDGFDAVSPSISAVVAPTCGSPGLLACSQVNGALLTVAAVVTGTAGDTPVAGAVADIVQAGVASGTGASVSDQPCYPQSGGTSCGPVPAGEPATASSATCTTLTTGSCPLTAMWDGSDEDFSSPDTVTLYPPPGYVVTGVSGCAPVAGPAPAQTCHLTVPDGSNPLTVTFGLEPVSLLTVNLAGPLEPGCDPLTCLGPTYDDDAVDGVTVTVAPTGTTTGAPGSCQVEGGSPGDTSSGQDATCTLALVPGTYSVSLPSSISTPDSEVDIASAYVTGQDPQAVTLAAGADEDVNFTSAYEPTITVNLAGPLEPSEAGSGPGDSSAEGAIYDNDAVDGTTVTVTPASGTGGSPVSCQVDGGFPGDNVDFGQPATCNVNVPPGTYSVSAPSSIQTPDSEVGIPVAYVSGANPQTVSVQVGDDPSVNFASAYEPTITVNLAGPLEPNCVSTTCTADQMVYDNDAVDDTTATVTPSGGAAGAAQTCQLEGGYPGDNVDYGQPSSCIVGETPGTYSVSLPSTIQTPDSEVDIAMAYVTGQNPQSVTLSPGENVSVNFTSGYAPTITITVAGPEEPSCGTGACPPGGKVYDDDAVDGITATVKPTGGTSGPTLTCQVEGGEPDGTAGARQEASCNVGVSPGTYKVSVPARFAPSADYGWGYIDVKGADPQPVTVASGGANAATFTTQYEAMGNIGSGAASARTKDGLVTATGSGGTGTVTVGEYGSDPEGPPTFNKYSASNDFFDVSVSSDSTFDKLVFTVCGLHGNSDGVSWWDTTGVQGAQGAQGAPGSGRWVAVSPAAAVRSLKTGCLTTTLTGTTSPAITDLGGTVFGVALHLAAQRVTFTSSGPGPAVVGGTYRPRASASSRLPVGFSIDAASAKEACSLTASGTLKFTGAGACVLDATQAGSSYWAAASVKRNFDVLSGKPVAEATTYSTPAGKPLRVVARKGILAKDSVNGSTIVSHTSPAHGTLTLLGNGAFTYVPRPSFSGTDRFSYTLRNSLGRSTATIRIEVENPMKGRGAQVRRG